MLPFVYCVSGTLLIVLHEYGFDMSDKFSGPPLLPLKNGYKDNLSETPTGVLWEFQE